MCKHLLEETTFVAEDIGETQREAIRRQEEEWICKVKEEFEDAERLNVEYVWKNNTALPTIANVDQLTKERQGALLKRKIEQKAFWKHVTDLQQLIKNKSYRETLIYSVVRDSQNEAKNLFQFYKKAHAKYKVCNDLAKAKSRKRDGVA